MSNIKNVKVGDFVLIKGIEHWSLDKDSDAWLVDGILFESYLDTGNIEESQMAKSLGGKITIQEIIDSPEELPELVYFKCTDGWIWEGAAIDRVITIDTDPEHFV